MTLQYSTYDMGLLILQNQYLLLHYIHIYLILQNKMNIVVFTCMVLNFCNEMQNDVVKLSTVFSILCEYPQSCMNQKCAQMTAPTECMKTAVRRCMQLLCGAYNK